MVYLSRNRAAASWSLEMSQKNVLCTTVTVDVMGAASATARRIRTAEEVVLDALRRLASDFKSNRVPRAKGFVLFLPDDNHNRRIGGKSL